MMEPQNLKTKQDYIDFFRSIGLNVIPCQPRKKEPAVAWKKYQSEKYIEKIGDDQNIAILCGAISNDLFVVDLDDPELIKDFEMLKQKTLVVQSGSGGYHIYCRPNGEKPHTMRFTNHKGQHVDLQSDGTYVLAPPSIHPDSGEEYKIVSSTLDIGLIHITSILHKLKQHGFETDKGSKPLSEIIKGVGEGERNANAFKYACYLLQREMLDDGTAWFQMQEWNKKNKPPLDEAELQTIFKHAASYERPKESKKKKDESQPTHTDYAIMIMQNYIFKTVRETDEVLIYENGVYMGDKQADVIIKEQCERIIPECNTHDCNEVLNTIRRKTYRKRTLFDADLNIINMKNGLLNIETLELKPHDAEYLSRVQLPMNYEPKAIPNNFVKFLRQCLPDAKDYYTVLEGFASCLLRTSKFEKAFMFVGEGANGKSTFLEVMQAVLGEDNISNISIHDLVTNRFAKAELEGKMANIYADIESSELAKTGVLKMLISGEKLDVERKNIPHYKMRSFAKLFFSANRFPQVNDQSKAMFRRFIIIDWIKSFEGKADTKLKDRLTTISEMEGIFNIVSRIAKKLYERGNFLHDPNVDLLRKKWNELATPIQKFIDEKAAVGPDYYVERVAFFAEYAQFCVDNNLIKESPNKFYEIVSGLLALQESQKRVDGEPVRIFKGVTLRSRLRVNKQGSL